MLRHLSQADDTARERHVKLFRNGRNQAIRIPREFELPRKEGDRLIVEPAPPTSLLALLATLDPLDEDLPLIVMRHKKVLPKRVAMPHK
jgi:antitoxin VapB